MTELSAAQCAVLAATRRELGRIGTDQQGLADDLAEALGDGASDTVVTRLQAFDLLRQRIDLLAEVLAVLETSPSADLKQAVPACLTLTTLRRDFAAALGAEEEPGDGDAGTEEDIELF
jgi:hypothetical protein